MAREWIKNRNGQWVDRKTGEARTEVMKKNPNQTRYTAAEKAAYYYGRGTAARGNKAQKDAEAKKRFGKDENLMISYKNGVAREQANKAGGKRK